MAFFSAIGAIHYFCHYAPWCIPRWTDSMQMAHSCSV